LGAWRNAALRAGQPRPVVCAWDGELIRYGELLTEARARYVAQLTPVAQELGRNLLAMELTLSYRTGWGRNSDLREALEQSWPQDQESGATHVGPHRAELGIAGVEMRVGAAAFDVL